MGLDGLGEARSLSERYAYSGCLVACIMPSGFMRTGSLLWKEGCGSSGMKAGAL